MLDNKVSTKQQLSVQLIVDLLAATPEAFFNRAEIDAQRFGFGSRSRLIQEAVESGKVGKVGNFIFDVSRVTAEQVQTRSLQFFGTAPQTSMIDGSITVAPVAQRIAERDAQLQAINDPALFEMMGRFRATAGFYKLPDLLTGPTDQQTMETLIGLKALKKDHDFVFDPLQISRPAIERMRKKSSLAPVREAIFGLLDSAPGKTIARVDLVEKYGSKSLQAVIDSGGLLLFSVTIPLGESVWVRLEDSDEAAAIAAAQEALAPKDEDWQISLDYCGVAYRHDADPALINSEKRKDQVQVRSYPVQQAAARVNLFKETLQTAILSRQLIAFVDPEAVTRIPAYEIDDLLADPMLRESIAEYEYVRLRELMIVLDEPRETAILNRLRKLRSPSPNKWRWSQLKRALWPDSEITLAEFREIYVGRREAWDANYNEQQEDAKRQREEFRLKERAQREAERREREALRARLLAAFPAWQHAGRADQRVIFHVGPPNSGKTHNALDRLAMVESGWYLAPLRLLAFEIFDRMNKRGIPCNLLTGEEYIEIPGARITAATIEMFNASQSGEVVVIDEAQMLADPDRGWAWTRALMEAQAPEIYVIGPHHVKDLLTRLASSAAIPTEIVEHARLAPISVANKPWQIQNLPPRTILVAFSRRMVLSLKTELEQYRRTVSVVYGNLPPEVRRKQAERFAEGQTEICIATDAVGMGLNLPADRVCFFEMTKFDGREMRSLTPSEVHQIGGRAGRYGLSTAGEIGAVNRRDLKLLNVLFSQAPDVLTHARVAPVVEDLELLPGSLARRFAQWRELQSIPESLRGVIKPADIDERIALAQMLTDREVEQLGLPAAVQIVNAPTREASRSYWYSCAKAILRQQPMPLPPEAPFQIDDSRDLDDTEAAISCADIYLWLACRPEFSPFGQAEPSVREVRMAWSIAIDAALMRRVDTAARCINCNKRLPLNHRFSLCDDCYSSGGQGRFRR